MPDLSVCSEETSGVQITCDCDLKPVEKVYFSTPDKKLESGDEIIKALMYEAIKFCRDRLPRDPKLTSSFTGCLYFTHCYFTASRWRTPEETYYYFKESLLCHAVECPPFSMEIFTPAEAKEAILYFYETYLRNLPLARILCLPHYKLRLTLDGVSPATEKQEEIIKKKQN